MLTGTGRATALLAAALLTVGIALGYPELVAIGLACVTALVVAVVWIAARPDVIAVRELAPARVAQGEPSIARMTVTNRRGRRCPPIVAEEVVGTQSILIAIPSLAGHGSHTVQYSLPTDRRGIFAVGPLTIGQADPLRLMSFGRSFTSRSTLWVYPRIHRLSGLLSERASDLEGPTSSGAPQGGVAFHAIRPWVWGDDHRFIDWKATARTETLHVRQMVIPDEPRVLVVLDTSSAPYTDESFEDAVRAAASIAHAAVAERYPLEFRTTGGVVVLPDRVGATDQPVLDVLAAVRHSADDPGLGALLRMLPDQADITLFVVTGQAPAAQIGAVGTVRPRFRMVTLAQLGDRFDRPIPTPAGVVGVNAATSDQLCQLWNRLVPR